MKLLPIDIILVIIIILLLFIIYYFSSKLNDDSRIYNRNSIFRKGNGERDVWFEAKSKFVLHCAF